MMKRFTAVFLTALLSACDGGTTSTNSTTISPTAAPVALGKVGKADGVELTVTKIDQRSQIGAGAAAIKASPTETYVVARYALKNAGSAPLAFMERPELSLVDSKGQTYAADMPSAAMATTEMDELNGMANDINPNVTAKVVAVWKVDKAAFDKGTWKLVLGSNPQLTFALK